MIGDTHVPAAATYAALAVICGDRYRLLRLGRLVDAQLRQGGAFAGHDAVAAADPATHGRRQVAVGQAQRHQCRRIVVAAAPGWTSPGFPFRVGRGRPALEAGSCAGTYRAGTQEPDGSDGV